MPVQAALFEHVLASPPSAQDAPARAALAAYARELEPYHGRVLRRVYRFGLPKARSSRLGVGRRLCERAREHRRRK